ncbi:hypothetical protein [Nocardia sp. A7]|uniref:hypothetical protein n=1 Tax=Nocardia sp. A7 TaxID=2789274 RepID=UPI0039780CD2
MVNAVDDLLTKGARALNYFWHLTPVYIRAFGTDDGWPREKFGEIYNAEQGMNTEKLTGATWNATSGLLAAAGAQRDVQRQAVTALKGNWQGEAGTQGTDLLTRMIQEANDDIEHFKQLSDAIFTAGIELPTVVSAKVDAILRLMPESGLVEVAGMSDGDIEAILTARDSGELSETVWSKLLRTPFGAGQSTERTQQATKDLCDQWINTIFRPDYVDKRTKFVQICEEYKGKVQAIYQKIIEAGKLLPEDPKYPMASGAVPVETKPEGDPAKSTEDPSKATGDKSQDNGAAATGGSKTDGNGGGTTAAATKTEDASASAGSPAKTATPDTDTDTDTDTTTDDTSTDDDTDASSALSTLTSAISELGTTLSSALTGDLGDTLTSAAESVGTSISDGIEQMTEQASSLLSGEHEASFQLGDTKVSIEAGENGLSLTTTDANGDSQQYRLTLDDNGLPVLEQESSSADPAATDDDSNGASGSGTPESGTEQGEAGLAESAPGAEGATPPTAETPDPTNAPVTDGTGDDAPSSGPGAGGVPAAPRSSQQETDGEHTPSIDDHEPSNPGDSGAVLSEAGPL